MTPVLKNKEAKDNYDTVAINKTKQQKYINLDKKLNITTNMTNDIR